MKISPHANYSQYLLVVFIILLSACSAGKHLETDLQQPSGLPPADETPVSASEQPSLEPIPGFDDTEEDIYDPLEPVNKTIFAVNDKFYFWFIKPATTGYNWAVPEGARKSVKNFFYNIEMPVRFVSSLMQAQVKSMGIELARFTINSTIGVAGLFDVAKSSFSLEPQEKDIAQALGRYGVGEGLYLVWPFAGPSTARETAGSIIELFLTPWRLVQPDAAAAAIGVYDYFNRASLEAYEYEELVKSSLEPYSALKNAYIQYRRNIVNNK